MNKYLKCFDMEGWIKMHRKIVNWRYYTDVNTFRLFTHLLFKAQWKPVTWGETELSPGQLITGRKVLANELRLSEQEIRTSLDRLKKGQEITIKTTNKFSIVTICNWVEYQSNEVEEQPTTQPALQPTNNQQITNKQPHTRKKEEKEEKKGKKAQPDALRFPFVSKEFIELWEKLIKMPKWKNKLSVSLQMSLDKLEKYDEGFSKELIKRAIEGNYQGVVFTDTDEQYRKFINGRKNNFEPIKERAL